MGAGVVDKQQIAPFNFRQHTVHGKFVAVLAKGAGHIVLVVAGLILLAQHRHMVIRTVDGRAHQVHRTGIHSNVFFMGMFFMDCRGYQTAIRSHHKTSHLGINRHIAHTVGGKHLIIHLMYTGADLQNIIRLLLRTVGNANAAGQIDKADFYAQLVLQLHCYIKQHLGQQRIILVGHRIGAQECVQTELLYALGLHDPEGLKQLFGGHTVLGVPRVVHNIIGDLKHTAGIVAAAHFAGQLAAGFFHGFNMGNVIQVDDTAQVVAVFELL